MKFAKFFDVINSDGFGGIDPDKAIKRSRTVLCCFMMSSIGIFFYANEVICYSQPGFKPSCLAMVGLLKSNSSNTTDLPINARLAPRLIEKNVFPSPLILEVTSKPYFPCPRWQNKDWSELVGKVPLRPMYCLLL